MKFTKRHLCRLPSCYAVGSIQVQGRTKYIFATDGPGPCYCVDAETGERETIWDGPGGTMSIVPIPGTDGAFLASQNFMPGFRAAHVRIVEVRYAQGGWRVSPWLELPYAHRFDILQRGGQHYFLGCILSSTRRETAQWDKAGTLVAAPLGPDLAPPTHLEIIADGMSHNHGYCRVERPGFTQAYTACDQGVFQVTPPSAPQGDWEVRRLLDIPASDVAVCDIDGDGAEELATIQPFHGDTFVIYHTGEQGYWEYYRHPREVPFLHAIFGGNLCGRPVFLAGCREGDKEFFLVRHTEQGAELQVVETGFGPSNVAVLPGRGRDTVLIANRESHEGALFTVEEELP